MSDERIQMAKDTFNETWGYLDKDSRTPEDDHAMLGSTLTSWYLWRQVGDAKNHCISDWQVARVFAVLGEGALAKRFAQASLDGAGDLGASYVGFAHEALARAAKVLGDSDALATHKEAAEALLDEIDDEESRELLVGDLADL